MTPELLKSLAADNLWAAIAPEIMVAILALLLLVAELVLPKKRHDLIPLISLSGILGVLLGLLMNFSPVGLDETTFNGLLRHTQGGQFLRVFFVLSALLVTILGIIALKKQRMPKTEFFSIVLVVTAALMLLGQAHNFAALEVNRGKNNHGFHSKKRLRKLMP